jgi:uncharacterized protein YjiS (DUF1127 family)
MSRNSTILDPFTARVPFLNLDATGIAAAISRRVRLAVRRWQKRRTIRALERLDDWILEDLGISRGEIPRFVDSLVDDDPRPASLARTAGMARQQESQES